MDGLRDPLNALLALAAGVEVELDWGVICGVGSIGGRGMEGSDGWLGNSMREGSNVMSMFRRKEGICSWMDGRLVVGSCAVDPLRGDGDSAMRPESRFLAMAGGDGVAGSTGSTTVSSSEVSRGMTARQQLVPSAKARPPAPGVYFKTMSVHRWKVASEM